MNNIVNSLSEESDEYAGISVFIQHPFGDVWVPLKEWIRRGPGPRYLLRPITAREDKTEKELPLTVIPLQYRNDEVSRGLIRAHLLEDPWKDVQIRTPLIHKKLLGSLNFLKKLKLFSC